MKTLGRHIELARIYAPEHLPVAPLRERPSASMGLGAVLGMGAVGLLLLASTLLERLGR